MEEPLHKKLATGQDIQSAASLEPKRGHGQTSGHLLEGLQLPKEVT